MLKKIRILLVHFSTLLKGPICCCWKHLTPSYTNNASFREVFKGSYFFIHPIFVRKVTKFNRTSYNLLKILILVHPKKFNASQFISRVRTLPYATGYTAYAMSTINVHQMILQTSILVH